MLHCLQVNQVLNRRQANLDAAPPQTLSKYDPVGSLLQGLLSADFDAPGASKYDMVCRKSEFPSHRLRMTGLATTLT